MITFQKQTKVLLVVTEVGWKRAVEQVIKLVKSGLDATVYVLYVVDMEPLPAIVSEEEEKKFYESMREKGNAILQNVIKELTNEGITTEIVGMYFGIAEEEIARVEKELKPSIIVLDGEDHHFMKFMRGNLVKKVIEVTEAPVLIAKE